MTSINDILKNNLAETIEISAKFSHQVLPKAVEAYDRFLEDNGMERYLTKVFITPTGKLHFEAVIFGETPDVVENIINLEDELKYFIDTGVNPLRTRDIINYLTGAIRVGPEDSEDDSNCQCDQMDALLGQLTDLCSEKPFNFKKAGTELIGVEVDFDPKDSVDLYAVIKIFGTTAKVKFYTYECGDKISAEELYDLIFKALTTHSLI